MDLSVLFFCFLSLLRTLIIEFKVHSIIPGDLRPSFQIRFHSGSRGQDIDIPLGKDPSLIAPQFCTSLGQVFVNRPFIGWLGQVPSMAKGGKGKSRANSHAGLWSGCSCYDLGLRNSLSRVHGPLQRACQTQLIASFRNKLVH